MTAVPTHQNSLLSCPYKGLIPYGEEDASIFFGREDWCTIIANNLLASRLTLLYGASGVGKSSVLQAGVANRLKKQAKQSVAEHGEPEWAVIVCKDWRDDPLITLRKTILTEVEGLIGRPPLAAEMEPGADLLSLLQACSQAIARVNDEGTTTPGKLLLILDQFEEYFLYHPQDNGAASFAEQFPRAVNEPALSLNVLISLREDSLAKLDRFKQQLPDLFANRLQIEHLDRAAAIDAIRKPIEEFNRHLPPDSRKASVEPQLIQDVLEQVKVGQIQTSDENSSSDQPAPQPSKQPETLQVETPFLQLVMTRLWEEECRVERPPRLRQDTLTRLGGAGTIVREHLERLMAGLPESSKRVAVIIFDKLVTSGLTKIAYPVFELTDPAKVDRPEDLLNPQELKALLDHLSGGSQRILRRLPLAPEQPNAAERYEIFHDVLAKPILEWRRRYRQTAEMETERQRHAEELQTERKRRQRNLWISAGLGLPLLAASSYLLFKNQQLKVKQQELTVIESAQQFKVQQLDQLDALVQALAAAHWLQARGSQSSPGAARDIGANLRHILDHIQERFKAQLLTAEERQINPPWISKILPKTSEVAFLFRNGTFFILNFEGQLRPLPQGLATTTGPVRPNAGQGGGSPLQRLISWLPRWPQAWWGPAKQSTPDGRSPIKVFALSDSGGRIATLSKPPSRDELLLQVWESTRQQPIYQDTIRASVRSKSTFPSMSPFQLRNRLALSPDGQRLATASLDDWLRILPLPARSSLPQPPAKQLRIPELALVRFSPDGQQLAAADRNGRIHLLDPLSGSEVNSIQLPKMAGFLFSLDFAPDGQRLAIASRDGKVRLYSKQGKLLQEINTGRIFQLRFSPDGRLLATGSRDGSSEVLDLEAPAARQSLARFLNQAAVVDLQFSADGRELTTISAAGMLHQWQVPEPPPKGSRSGPGQQLSALTFNRASDTLAWAKVGSESACLLPLAEARPSSVVTVPLPTAPCGLSLRAPVAREKLQPTDLARLKFNGAGSTLAGLAWDGTGTVWDRSGQRLGSIQLPTKPQVFAPFSGLSFSPDGQRFAFVARGDSQGEMVLCDLRQLNNGSLPCRVAQKNPLPKQAPLDLTSLHFLHRFKGDGPELVVSAADGRLCFANLQGREMLQLGRCVAIPTGQGELAVSPDDAWIGLAGVDGSVFLWQRNGNTLSAKARQIKVSAGPLLRTSFQPSPDPQKRFLAAVSLDGTASLWSLNGQQLATFRTDGGDRGGYLGAEFEKGGDLLLWTLNGSLHREAVQDLPMLIERGCDWLKRYRQGAITPDKAKSQLKFCQHTSGTTSHPRS
jgi:WD40 repeat protein